MHTPPIRLVDPATLPDGRLPDDCEANGDPDWHGIARRTGLLRSDETPKHQSFAYMQGYTAGYADGVADAADRFGLPICQSTARGAHDFERAGNPCAVCRGERGGAGGEGCGGGVQQSDVSFECEDAAEPAHLQ